MPLPSTMTPIATITLASNQSTVTFNNIPSTYTDLTLISSAQATSSGTGIQGRLNGDTAGNYSFTVLRGNGTSAASARVSNVFEFSIGNTAEIPTTFYGTYITHFMSYASTNVYKSILSRADNALAATNTLVNLWRSTSAISSMSIFTSSNFTSGSTFTLYGIKAA